MNLSWFKTILLVHKLQADLHRPRDFNWFVHLLIETFCQWRHLFIFMAKVFETYWSPKNSLRTYLERAWDRLIVNLIKETDCSISNLCFRCLLHAFKWDNLMTFQRRRWYDIIIVILIFDYFRHQCLRVNLLYFELVSWIYIKSWIIQANQSGLSSRSP